MTLQFHPGHIFREKHGPKRYMHPNDAFELWCWKRLLRVLWTARITNQSILKESSPEYSLEGLMLKLKLHVYFVTLNNHKFI